MARQPTLPSGALKHQGFGNNPLLPHATRPLTIVSGKSQPALQAEVAQCCPAVPGVYGIIDRHGELIYVGKSKSLRHRLMSYFQSSSRREKSGRIIQSARAVQWESQPNEFAALLREQQLIRRFRPRWNVQGLPEHQRPVYLCLGRQPAPYFFAASLPPAGLVACEGPFYGASRMNRAVVVLNHFFQLRDCSQRTPFFFADQLPLFDLQRRPGCLRYDTGTCLAPCAAACSRAQYDDQVAAAKQFLAGASDQPLQMLQRSMEAAAANQQYELAARRLDDYQAMQYLHGKLTALAQVRDKYTFVYESRGFDHAHQWYLIRAGEVADVMPRPIDATTLVAAQDRLEQWRQLADHRGEPGPGDFAYTLNLVASWFRNQRQELQQTFPVAQAAARLAAQDKAAQDKAA